MLSVSAASLVAAAVIAAVARQGGESTVMMEPTVSTDASAPTPGPTTTTAPTTTRPPTTSVPTTTGPQPTTTVLAPQPTSTARQVRIRIVGPYGVPFTKGHTIAQACPTVGGDCVFSTKIDHSGNDAIGLDTATTYTIMAMAGNTGWPNPSPGDTPFHFSRSIETTGAGLEDGTAFVVDGRPGAPAVTALPDFAALLDTDAAQRACGSVRDAVVRLAEIGGSSAAELADGLSEIGTTLAAVEQSAPVEIADDLDWLTTMVEDFVTQLRELAPSRALASGEDAAVIDALVAAVPMYFRTVASREGLTGPAPGLAACGLRSNGAGAADDMFVFSAAIEAFLASELGQGPQFVGLTALADVTAHAERGRTPMSTFVNSFEECRNDAGATRPGDNVGCDRMHQACEDGDMLACNDLYYSARVINSPIELFGFFCGNRLVPEQQSNAVAGYCELM
jgi:hypothetical protein